MTRPSATIMAEIAEAKKRAAALRVEIAEIDTRRTELDLELLGIIGPWGRAGRIADLERELAAAQRAEADAARPRCRVLLYGTETEHVVVKVTAKCITTRAPGETSEWRWYFDGSPVNAGRYTTNRLIEPERVVAKEGA